MASRSVRTALKSGKKPPTTCSPGDAIDATPAKTNGRRLRYRIVRIFRISSSLYGVVLMIIRRSSKSSGNPCGDLYCVPLILAMPRFVAGESLRKSRSQKVSTAVDLGLACFCFEV